MPQGQLIACLLPLIFSSVDLALIFAMVVANLDVPQKGKGLGFTKEVCNLQFQVHNILMYLNN
jgi:hypothetical protein